MNIFGSVIWQFGGPEFVEGILSAFLGTDGINRSCGAAILKVKKGTNIQSVAILLHARSAILFACVAQFMSVPHSHGLNDQLIEPALDALLATKRGVSAQY